MKRKHLLGLKDLSADEITDILDRAEGFKKKEAGRSQAAGGQIGCHAFL